LITTRRTNRVQSEPTKALGRNAAHRSHASATSRTQGLLLCDPPSFIRRIRTRDTLVITRFSRGGHDYSACTINWLTWSRSHNFLSRDDYVHATPRDHQNRHFEDDQGAEESSRDDYVCMYVYMYL